MFNPGDVVRLKHYHDKMTVDHVRSNDIVQCVWFDEDDNLNRGTFYAIHLELVGENQPTTKAGFVIEL